MKNKKKKDKKKSTTRLLEEFLQTAEWHLRKGEQPLARQCLDEYAKELSKTDLKKNKTYYKLMLVPEVLDLTDSHDRRKLGELHMELRFTKYMYLEYMYDKKLKCCTETEDRISTSSIWEKIKGLHPADPVTGRVVSQRSMW
jgi:hypothetical protein